MFGYTQQPWLDFAAMVDTVYAKYSQGGKFKLVLSEPEVKMVMSDAYDEWFKIRKTDEAHSHRDIPSVAYYWTENSSHYFGLRDRIEQHITNKVTQLTGLSLREFLDYPRHVVETILLECSRHNSMDSSVQSKVMAKLGLGQE